jgi:uncharacterized protein YprB with RNaseH-like and TPR domain
MSDALERLRRLAGLRPQRSRTELTYVPLDAEGEPRSARSPAVQGRLEELAPGQEVETTVGSCYVATTAFPLEEERGCERLANALEVRPATLALFHPEFRLDRDLRFTDAVFLDTETTGLGGAGVYAFMVGVGTFERWEGALHRADSAAGSEGARATPTHFVIRQFFMRHPGEEAALLAALGELLETKQWLVTFNGRSFDLPLLRSRYRQNLAFLPAPCHRASRLEEGQPHLDLLPPARRLWRRRLQSCRLIHLEQRVLGVERGEEDVPGALIPALYLDYLRTGQAGEMRRVFYHNREDIVSMAALASHLVRVYASELTQPDELAAEDLFSLALCHESQDATSLAERAYRLALERAATDALRNEIFARWSALLKRQARWKEAAELWERWFTTVKGADVTPFIELAKYHEWQTRDLEQAEMWAAWALHTVEALPAHRRLPGQRADLEHRLRRIQNKRKNLRKA